MQSTDEAIKGGVPLIGIPMMWDQWYNVNKYVQLKIGLQLDINTITESTLRKAIETVIGNKRYIFLALSFFRSISGFHSEFCFDSKLVFQTYILGGNSEN